MQYATFLELMNNMELANTGYKLAHIKYTLEFLFQGVFYRIQFALTLGSQIVFMTTRLC